MNIPLIAYVFDRKKQSSDSTPGKIEIRITSGKIQKYVATGISVLPGCWSRNMVVNLPNAASLNNRISIMRRQIDKYINDCIESCQPVDMSAFKSLVRVDDSGDNFLDFVADRAASRNVRAGTRARYDVFVNNLIRYGRLRKFSDLTPAAILEYNEWLHRQTIGDNRSRKVRSTARDKQTLSDSAIYNYHKCLKAFCHDAYIRGLIPENPYNRLPADAIKRGDRQTADYLTEDEMLLIMNTPMPTQTVQIAADLFTFQMFTGMSYADLVAFDFNDYKLVNGKWIYHGQRVKSGVTYFSQLLPPAYEVAKKYDFVLPVMENSQYNAMLKLVAAECHLKRRLYSHLARHTFATYMLSHGSRLQNVSRMLGHTNTRQTQRYAATLDADVSKDFDAVAKQLTEKKPGK
jgi:integrase